MRVASAAILAASIGLVASFTQGAAAPEPHARVSLKVDTDAVTAGKPFTVAVVFEMDPGWHIYYKDPGESGMPPEVKWTLPTGMGAGELQFPKPEVLKTPAGTNFVYHDEVWLLATITPGEGFKPDGSTQISADIKWLECDADLCLPGKGKASVKVGEAIPPAQLKQFESWRAKVKEAESFDPAAAK